MEQECPTWLEPSPCGKYLIAAHELGGAKAVEGYGFLSSYAGAANGIDYSCSPRHRGILVTRAMHGARSHVGRCPVNPVSGSLTKINTMPTGGRGNTCVGFDRTGKFVLTTRYWEAGIAVHL